MNLQIVLNDARTKDPVAVFVDAISDYTRCPDSSNNTFVRLKTAGREALKVSQTFEEVRALTDEAIKSNRYYDISSKVLIGRIAEKVSGDRYHDAAMVAHNFFDRIGGKVK